MNASSGRSRVRRAARTLTLPPRTRSRRSTDLPIRVAYFVETTGLQRLLEDAIPRVASAGVEPRFVSLHPPGPLHATLEGHGIDTFSLSCHSSKEYPRATAVLGRFLRKERVDILQACEPIQAAIGGVASLVSPGVIHVYQRQHMWISSRVQRSLSEVGTRLSHYTLVNSHATARWVEEVERVPGTKIRVAHYGVPPHRRVAPDEIAALRSLLRIPEDAQVILLPGFLRPEKGHRVLIEALPEIRAGARGPVHLLFVGRGPEEESLRRLCSGDDAIHVAGYQEDIAPWFALADVVAVPSLYDSFPQAAVEAFATSRPLVASAVGGLEEIVDSGSGILVPPGEPHPLAEGILEVLRSPELAARLAAAGHQRYERNFTVDAMVGQWVRFYDELLRGAHERPPNSQALRA